METGNSVQNALINTYITLDEFEVAAVKLKNKATGVDNFPN